MIMRKYHYGEVFTYYYIPNKVLLMKILITIDSKAIKSNFPHFLIL